MKKHIEGLETRKLLSHTLDDGHDHGIPLPNDHLFPRGADGDYQLGTRWSSTASGSTGTIGNPITLTWGIVNDGLSIPGAQGEPTSPSDLVSKLNAKYGSQATWLPLFQSVFDRWGEISGITYLYEPNDDGAAFSSASGQLGVRADLRISGHHIDGGFNILAYNFFPGTGNGGNMVIDTSELISGGAFVSTTNNSRAFRNMLSHEHGHGMGLGHVMPTNNTKLMEPFLATNFDGPQYDDILAAQSYYGDPLEKDGRNETAAKASDLGTLALGTNQTLAQRVSIANTSDNDYFKFTVDAGTSVNFTLQPDGLTYSQGPQSGGSPTDFNAAAAGNLNFALYDTNGAVVLQTANVNPAGFAETLSTVPLAAGTYFVRVTMVSGTTQMYKLMASVSTGLAAPSTPDLAAASDTGLSSSDNITNDTTPTLSGSALPSSTITIFVDGTEVGTTTASPSGNWTATLSEPLADGAHAITAKAFNGTLLSDASQALTLTVDTAPPAVASSSYDREVTQRVSLVFDDAIAGQISASEVVLTNATTTAVTNAISVLTSGGNTIATFVITSSRLANGRYTLSLAGDAATDVAGNALTEQVVEFTQVAGDATGDGIVDFDDLLVVAQNYNTNGKTFSQGNFNYDGSGIVDFGDLLTLAQNYGVNVFQSSAVIGSSPIQATTTKRRTNNVELLA